MNKNDYRAWSEKTERLNANHDLQVGDHFYDAYNNRRGKITLIDDWAHNGPLTNENHGTINVILDTGEEEHYCLVNWKQIMRIEHAYSR